MRLEELQALVVLMMCTDPWPAGCQSGEEILMGLVDRESKKYGFRDWVEAYHRIGLPPLVGRSGGHQDPSSHKLDRILSLLEAQGKTLQKVVAEMSKIDDLVTEVDVELQAAKTRILEDVSILLTRIGELQAQVDAGGASPETLAKLEAMKATLAALDPMQPDTLPTPA